jgi:Lipocalin-like domain
MSGAGTGLPSPADLVGTWRLRDWTSEGEDGSIDHPFGESPEGALVYTADGTMITTIGRSSRPPIDGGDILAGPVDQRLDAMSTFIAYSGTFRVEGQDVVHDVTMSLFPNWIRTTQRRHVALSDDRRELTLSADPLLLRGRLSTQRLCWERVTG